MTNTFVSRWGIPELDDYRWLNIPGFIMRNWSKFVSIQEWSFILQIMSFKFDSENGQASPSLETITDELGYKNVRSVQTLKKSLVKKGLLEITERSGFTDIYNFKIFAKKCHSQEMHSDSLVNCNAPVPLNHNSGGVVSHDSPEDIEYKNKNIKSKNSYAKNEHLTIETVFVLASLLSSSSPLEETESEIVKEAKKIISEETVKKRDRLFDGVAMYSFQIDTKKPESKTLINRKGNAGRIGKVVSWLKTLHKDRELDEDAQANELWEFYQYYGKKYPDASKPRDKDKFAEHYTAFLQSDEVNSYHYNNTRKPTADDYAVPESAKVKFDEEALKEMGIIT